MEKHPLPRRFRDADPQRLAIDPDTLGKLRGRAPGTAVSPLRTEPGRGKTSAYAPVGSTSSAQQRLAVRNDGEGEEVADREAFATARSTGSVRRSWLREEVGTKRGFSRKLDGASSRADRTEGRLGFGRVGGRSNMTHRPRRQSGARDRPRGGALSRSVTIRKGAPSHGPKLSRRQDRRAAASAGPPVRPLGPGGGEIRRRRSPRRTVPARGHPDIP